MEDVDFVKYRATFQNCGVRVCKESIKEDHLELRRRER
jgi:hypothetical protein